MRTNPGHRRDWRKWNAEILVALLCALVALAAYDGNVSAIYLASIFLWLTLWLLAPRDVYRNWLAAIGTATICGAIRTGSHWQMAVGILFNAIGAFLALRGMRRAAGRQPITVNRSN